MTYPDTSGLPVNIDTTYADNGGDATVKTHQQHHDTVHAAVKAAGPAPVVITQAAYDALTPPAAGVVYLIVG